MRHEEWSEILPVRDLIVPYCQGNGVDLGSKGIPIVPWAIQVELPSQKFQEYQGYPLPETVQWRGDALNLPFKDQTLDWVLASHLIEDYEDWRPILMEWIRVIKRGGFLIIQVPDKERFQAACRAGGSGNANHKHESYLGELSGATWPYGMKVVSEAFTDRRPSDYNILFIAVREII